MKKSVAPSLALVGFSLAITLGSPLLSAQSVNVSTWDNDNWRTGQNTDETTLKTGLVSQPIVFGRVCAARRALEGEFRTMLGG
jgi:hypothetical protein